MKTTIEQVPLQTRFLASLRYMGLKELMILEVSPSKQHFKIQFLGGEFKHDVGWWFKKEIDSEWDIVEVWPSEKEEPQKDMLEHLDAIAEKKDQEIHNPQNVERSQIPEGWRIMTLAEVEKRNHYTYGYSERIRYWDKSLNLWSTKAIGGDLTQTYITDLLPEELAQLP